MWLTKWKAEFAILFIYDWWNPLPKHWWRLKNCSLPYYLPIAGVGGKEEMDSYLFKGICMKWNTNRLISDLRKSKLFCELRKKIAILLIIYIYTYILLFTDKLFYCITTLQCGQTCEMLQGRIKIWLILCRSDILPLSNCHHSVREGIFKVHIHICLSATRELSSWEELCISVFK